MELLTVVQAGALTTAITSFITANIAAILAILGFMVGLSYVRRWVNSSVRGKL